LFARRRELRRRSERDERFEAREEVAGDGQVRGAAGHGGAHRGAVPLPLPADRAPLLPPARRRAGRNGEPAKMQRQGLEPAEIILYTVV